ncbi:MAG: ribosomal RNA small subunit methyltransferase E [Paracoccaceae bacterium]|nr:MAG: ribosomal RNA small subunit methyltransferase E [Paracoccaceae bacterium]
MTETAAKIRLFVDAPLAAERVLALDRGQAHYLGTVMRLAPGARIRVFNGRDGEWIAEIARIDRRGALAVARSPSAPQALPPDLWLLFAPIRRERTQLIVEKATELGVRRLVPVLTRRTQPERIRPEKLRAHIIEAAEQCGGTFLPELDAPRPLTALMADWPGGRGLVFCDESGGAPPLVEVAPPAPAAVLIGPVGGFDPEEAAFLRALPFCRPATLGPRILRADTAAVAALALWQAAQGDWR